MAYADQDANWRVRDVGGGWWDCANWWSGGGRELGKEGEQQRDRQKGVQKGPAVGKTGQSLPSLDKPCP